jgi:hypothetical protein
MVVPSFKIDKLHPSPFISRVARIPLRYPHLTLSLVESLAHGSRRSEVQLTIDRIDRISISRSGKRALTSETDERAARQALRAQVAKLERELSGVVVEGFPHIRPPASAGASARKRAGASSVGANRFAGAPRLLNLGQLERTRDELAGMVQTVRRAAAERAELETRSRELLERMQREPGRYKFVRLPVRDLGEHGCGVWEVRPRLGMLGMLAGWWQVKLSSGCPLG